MYGHVASDVDLACVGSWYVASGVDLLYVGTLLVALTLCVWARCLWC